jgi:hypothetical protein
MRLTWRWWGQLRFTIDRGGWLNRWGLPDSPVSLFRGREKIGVADIADGAGDQTGDDDEGISEYHGHGGRGL